MVSWDSVKSVDGEPPCDGLEATQPGFHLADLWEGVAARVPDRVAVTCGGRHLTYRELDRRADALARHLVSTGVGPGDFVGVHLWNGPEWFECLLAAFKLRAAAVNINFRYVAGELADLYGDATLSAVVVGRRFLPDAETALASLGEGHPTNQAGRVIVVDSGQRPDAPAHDAPGSAAPGYDGTGSPPRIGYEEALAGAPKLRLPGGRSGDDPYVIYTGGTTGRPKGVVWRQEDIFFAGIGGGDPMRRLGPVVDPAEVIERITPEPFVVFPLAPLMHAAAQWTGLSWLLAGGRVVLQPGSFDARAMWRTVAEERVNLIIIVGDAMARPLLDALNESDPGFDIGALADHLVAIGSGGAPLSPHLKDALMDRFPRASLSDGFGSSETGAQGGQRLSPGERSAGLTRFVPGAHTVVLDEHLRPVAPGSEVVGRVALSGRVPLRYHNDPVATARTMPEIGGRRWVITGDAARVAADGSVVLLGRGSGCINTGGEKVFAEEVEVALRSHPSVYDAVVVGAPDARFGECVAAVVQPVRGTTPNLDDLATHCRRQLAGYKVPRRLVIVDRVERSPAGKPDYRWARDQVDGVAD